MKWEVRFSRTACSPCRFRAQCTKAKKEPRIIGLQEREQYEALQAARQRQTTKEFRQQYAARAGIEGTHAQAIHRCGLRQCRYLGMAKVHLQHLLTAAALNLVRIADSDLLIRVNSS
jgi:transposase